MFKDPNSLETKVCRVHIVSAKTAIIRRCSSKLHVWTQIVTTFLTKAAKAARCSRFNSHSVTSQNKNKNVELITGTPNYMGD